jgi:hypothetical protein
VLAHSNGDGDFVLLELTDGPPWELHECYALRGSAVLDRSSRQLAKRAAKYARPVYGWTVRRGSEIEIFGCLSEIRERELSRQLKRMQPGHEKLAAIFFSHRTTELVVSVSETVQYRVYTDSRDTILGIGGLVRIVATSSKMPGLGAVLVCKDLESLQTVFRIGH